MTIEKAKAIAKSLRWVANQIPNNLADTEEDKMLKCIKLYCSNGSQAIEELCNQLSSYDKECTSCHSTLIPVIKLQGPHIGLYCKTCGKWQKWISSKEAKQLGFDIEELPF